MDARLHCQVTPGQFSDEFAINGGEFSLFAPKQFVEVGREPRNGNSVEGWLLVEVVEQDAQKALVRLPGEAFEVGYFVTVPNARLKTANKSPQKQS